jgi:hypothetical protein
MGCFRPIERKHGGQLAEAAGAANPYGYQEVLRRAEGDGDAVRDDLLDLVREHLADPAAGIGSDEMGFVKKGHRSVGVAPQYSGPAGQISHWQMGASWPTLQHGDKAGWIGSCICPANGPMTPNAAKRRACQRMTEALRARKQQGKPLARPKGVGKSKLDAYRAEIEALLKNGATKTWVAHRYQTTAGNLRH